MDECTKEGKIALLLGKSMERVSDTVVEEVGECVIYWIWREGFVVWG